ncbi:hypothetical protein H4R34_006128, partial [Dimargaris verticillata]
MQGRRHPGFREAWGLLRAVRHFYPYLDGCCNLAIEVDATTALGIFNHKSTCQADELSGIRAELAAMGVHADMIHHRPGETHLTADWLSRCLTRLRPRKASKALSDPTVAAFAFDHTILSDSGSDGSDLDDDSDDDELSASEDDVTSEDEWDSTAPDGPDRQHADLETWLQQALPETLQFSLTPADQLADPQLKQWRQLCDQRDSTTTQDDALFSEVADMAVQHDLVVKRVKGPTGTLGQWVPATPAAITKSQLIKWHRGLGHPGYDRLLAFAHQRLWCDQLVALVDHTTRTCHTCQLNAIPTRRYSPQSTALANLNPGEHLYLDFGHIGDLNEPDTQFMVMVDAASKFYQVVPLTSITAQDAVEALQYG